MKRVLHPSDGQLYLLSEGALEFQVEVVSDHIRQCPECRRRVASYRNLHHVLKEIPESTGSLDALLARRTLLPVPVEPRPESLLPVVRDSESDRKASNPLHALARRMELQRRTIFLPSHWERRWRRTATTVAAATLVGSGMGLMVATQTGSLLPSIANTEEVVLPAPRPLSPPRIGGRVFAPGGPLEVEILEGQRGGAYVSDLHLVAPGSPRLLGNNREPGKIVKLGSPVQGTELLFEIRVRDTGKTFRIGPEERNPDGMAHAAVQPLAGGEAILGFEDISKGGDGRYQGPDKGYNDFLVYLKRPDSPALNGRYVASLPMPDENWDINRPIGASIDRLARVGGKVISDGQALAVEVYKASGSVYTDEFRLVSPGTPKSLGTNRTVGKIVLLGRFAKGTELVFEMKNVDTGKVYRTGPASRNPDGIPHAAVQAGPNGQILVGFEDIDRGGNDRFSSPDYNYTDLVFRVFPVDPP